MKNIKFFYHLTGWFRLLLPKFIFQRRLNTLINNIPTQDLSYIQKRVNYYNKLSNIQSVSDHSHFLKDFKLSNHSSAYFHDTFQYIRYFNPQLKADFLFGDITFIAKVPSILKSRPISDVNQNSILLNLDKFRHFNFINDKIEFSQKKSNLVWRGHISIQKLKRIEFLKKFINHPLCNIGNTNHWVEESSWEKEKMTIAEQLNYKFILCLEGVDVATNLKWVMSSNSLAVMPKPTYETWFMEGTLIPNFHYVEIKNDFSDLEEKIQYYITNENEALKIIDNAHKYIDQFKDKKKEKLISLMVLQKYFEMTNQIAQFNCYFKY